MHRLEQLISAKLAELQHGVDVRRREGFETAGTLISSGNGKALMDQIRVQVTAMAAAEGRDLLEGRRETRKKECDTLMVAPVTTAVSIATRIAIALFLAGFDDVPLRGGTRTDPQATLNKDSSETVAGRPPVRPRRPR